MKKHFICYFLSFLFLISTPVFVQAEETQQHTQTIYMEDGRYMVITIESFDSRATATKTGSKTYSSKAADGTTEWQAVIRGTFTYDGTTAICTSSSCTVAVYADNWYEISKNVSKSGNTATASVTMGRKVLGITIARETYEMILTCNSNGELS